MNIKFWLLKFLSGQQSYFFLIKGSVSQPFSVRGAPFTTSNASHCIEIRIYGRQTTNPTLNYFKGQYSLLLQYGILEKLVTFIYWMNARGALVVPEQWLGTTAIGEQSLETRS